MGWGAPCPDPTTRRRAPAPLYACLESPTVVGSLGLVEPGHDLGFARVPARLELGERLPVSADRGDSSAGVIVAERKRHRRVVVQEVGVDAPSIDAKGELT